MAKLTGVGVPAAATFNVTMIQPLGRFWDLSGSVRNIFFNASNSDPVSSQHRQDHRPERPHGSDRAQLEVVDERAKPRPRRALTAQLKIN